MKIVEDNTVWCRLGSGLVVAPLLLFWETQVDSETLYKVDDKRRGRDKTSDLKQ